MPTSPRLIDEAPAHNLTLHIVWCSHRRQAVLTGLVAQRLRQLIRQRAAHRGWPLLLMMVMPDYVHLCLTHEHTLSAAHVANQFREWTSRALQREFPFLRESTNSVWSPSYFVGSSGAIPLETIQRFIESQSGHHYDTPEGTGILRDPSSSTMPAVQSATVAHHTGDGEARHQQAGAPA